MTQAISDHRTALRISLRVKIKSLAAEARIIKAEERRHRGTVLNHLHNHRIVAVRSEARHALLAYAHLRGVAYLRVEHPESVPPDLERLEKMVGRFGGDPSTLMDWRPYPWRWHDRIFETSEIKRLRPARAEAKAA